MRSYIQETTGTKSPLTKHDPGGLMQQESRGVVREETSKMLKHSNHERQSCYCTSWETAGDGSATGVPAT